MREAFNGCTLDEVTQMTSLTAAEVYGFDLGPLAPLADGSAPPSPTWSRAATEPVATYDPVDYALGKVSGLEAGVD